MLAITERMQQLYIYYFNFYWGFYFFSAGYFAWKKNRYKEILLRHGIKMTFIPV